MRVDENWTPYQWLSIVSVEPKTPYGKWMMVGGMQMPPHVHVYTIRNATSTCTREPT